MGIIQACQTRPPSHTVTNERFAAVQAWLSLLQTGHPYGTWPNVRLELKHLVQHFRLGAASDVALAQVCLVLLVSAFFEPP